MDFGTELLAYYSFTDDEIHNRDGSIAKFDVNLDEKELPYISNEAISVLQKVKGSRLPILEVINVENRVATATNLDIALSISNVDVEDGLYEIVSGAFKNDGNYNLSDFPRIKSSKETDKIGELKANELALIIESAAPFISDDDLRLVMQGVFLHKKYGKIKLAATNAHILISAAMDGNFEDTSKLSNIILREPKILSAALKLMGTENVSVIVGLSKAIELVQKEKDKITSKIFVLRDMLKKGLIEEAKKRNKQLIINGDEKNRLPDNLNICVHGINSEFVVIQFDEMGIACSSAAACNSKGSSSSYVIEELNNGCQSSSIRFSLGKGNTKQEIARVIKSFGKILDSLV
jgi:phosphohistidine swiveling domain-containing protein